MSRVEVMSKRARSLAALALAAAMLAAGGCRGTDEAVPGAGEVILPASDAARSETDGASQSESAEPVTEAVEETTDEAQAAGLREAEPEQAGDRWANAPDGMILETVTGKTFKGYVLLIRDPSRVSVGTMDPSFVTAGRIYQVADKYGAVAAINGGEFPDRGTESDPNPIGLTYSGGECLWNDGTSRTLMGFTADDRLIVEEGTSKERADALGIRDAVAFQNYNTLISSDGGNVTYHYTNVEVGISQRTAIGQLADGTVIFVVTDGRTAASLGASRNDIIDILAKYGAVRAGMLDGGASSLLWYRDWYTKYGVDEQSLNDWQRNGLVNIFKAFTYPRIMPTFFIVAPDGSSPQSAPDSTQKNTGIVVPEGYSVTVDGALLSERFITERDLSLPEAKYLPEGAEAIKCVKYSLAPSPADHEISVTDRSGVAAELVYDKIEKLYRAYPPSDEALAAEHADRAIAAMSEFALMMSADGSWDSVCRYFDPSSAIYNETMLSAQFTWTVLSHDSATVHDASASRFIRYGDGLFSCRVTLTNTLTKYGAVFNDSIDWTVIFRNAGGAWLICGLVFNG